MNALHNHALQTDLTDSGQSTDLASLVERNRDLAKHFAAGDLEIRPRLSTIILTCLDARVDPTHLFGLELGEALVIRNAGGRVTPAVVDDLGILGVLAEVGLPPRSNPTPLELVILHHNDCGMSRLANPAVGGQVATRLGRSADEISAMTIGDPARSVQDDIEWLRRAASTQDQLIVSGFVYDVTDGTIDQIVPPAPLRATN